MRHLLLFITVFCINISSAQKIMLVKDLSPGGDRTEVNEYKGCNGSLFFSAANDVNFKRRLWITDGDGPGTSWIKEFHWDIYGLTCMNNKVYFVAADVAGNYELWASDGTSSGTYLVKDINPGTGGSIRVNGSGIVSSNILRVLNNKLYFIANDNTHGDELWVSDGTGPGTQMVLDLNTVYQQNSGYSGVFSAIEVAGNLLFFGGMDSTLRYGLWASDGTAGGTLKISDIQPLPYSFFLSFNNELYFTGADSNQVYGLYKSNGTSNGTELLIPYIHHLSMDHAYLNNKLYFIGVKDTNLTWTPLVLYATDGTVQGSQLIKDSLDDAFVNIVSVFTPARVYLTNFNGKLYFSASVYSSNPAPSFIWESDGTPSGTLPFMNIQRACHLTVGNNKLYFKAVDSTRIDVFESDGYAQGTRKIIDSATNYLPGQTTSSQANDLRSPFCFYNNILFFNNTYDTLKGKELYKIELFPTSAPSLYLNPEYVIFPNPVHHFLNVSTKKDIDDIIIYDRTGKELRRTRISPVDVQDLNPGIYIIEVQRNGRKSFGKFLKE